MIETIKKYIWKAKYKHYSDMGDYYLDKAIGLGTSGHHEESEEYFAKANECFKKQYNMTMALMGLA